MDFISGTGFFPSLAVIIAKIPNFECNPIYKVISNFYTSSPN